MTQSTSFDDLDTPLDFAPAKAADIRAQASIVNGGERALASCPKCGGSGMTRWGRCFRCEGKGRVSVRSAAATKARATREQNERIAMRDFCRDHADVLAFLNDNEGWSDFFRSMLAQVEDGRVLTERQIVAVRSAMAKIAANRVAKAEARAAARPEVDMSAIRKLFDTAVENRLKRPVFRAGELEISKDREVGTATLWVRDGATKAWLGKVEGGRFNAFRAAKPDTLATLEQVAADPSAAAMAFARKFGRCSCCGATLKAGVSIVSAIGPICAGNWGLEHLRDAAAAAIANGEV